MFAVLANKRKIEEATSGKDDVAPVYLLEELWQIVQSSGPETAVGFVVYINKRLGMKSPIIKQKALRLIKFLCGKGTSDFKRQMAKHAVAVRELTHYRGDPDPYKGDVPNQKVRDSAKEALEAMFAPTETPTYSSTSTSSMHGRIQGFGSSNASDGFSAAATSKSGSSGMRGFGNPRYESASGNSGNRYSRGYEPVGETRSEGIGSMIQRVGSGALSPKAIMGSIAAKSNEFLSGRRGQGILRDDEQGGYSSDEADRGYEKPQVNGVSSAATSGQSGEEARLVDQICTPGGLRAQPTAEDLAVFVDSAGSMSGPVLAERLEDKVAGTSWQATLRALCALEAVVQRGHTASCGEIAVHFQTNPGVLERAAGSPQASVRQRALRLLQLLGVSSDSAASAPKAAAAAAAAPVPDLLGGLEEEALGAPAAASTPADLLGDLMAPAPGPAPSDGGMFSGLDVSASAPAQPSQAAQPAAAAPAEALDLFSGLDAPSAPAAAPAAAAPADLLAGLSTHNSSAAAARPALGDDLFGGPATAAGSAPAAELSEMFAGLSTAGSGGLSAQPPRLQTPQQLAAQRATSLEKQADPLSSLGLPQSSQTPMGYGASAQRGASPAATQPLPGMGAPNAGLPGAPGGGGMPQFNPQQLTPQQMQYIRQLQYMQYMQMQAMQAQARGMMPTGMPQFPDQTASAFSSQQQFASRPSGGSNGSGAPISLDALTGGGGGGSQQNSSLTQSSSLGITQRSDFDFVGEHVKSLRKK